MTRWLSVAAIALVACGASPTDARSPADERAASKVPALVDRRADDIVAVVPKNVTLAVSMPPLRMHAVGRQLLAMLLAARGVRDALSGTGIDPVRDLDWAYAAGASSKDDSKGGLIAHFALDDARVDDAFDAITKRSPTTAPLDVGAHGVRAVSVNLAGADRVLMRGASSLVLVVPPSLASSTATTLAASRVLSPVHGEEALRASLVDPHATIAQIPTGVQRGRAWVIAKGDGGLDVFGEGDCADAASASAAADEIQNLVSHTNGFLVRMATHRILDSLEVTTDGAMVKLHMTPTFEQLEATLAIAGAALGFDVPSPGN